MTIQRPKCWQMLAVIRQAPVEWFPFARGLLDLIDRLPHLQMLAQAVRQPLAQLATATTSAASPLLAASQRSVLAQAAVLAQVGAKLR